MVLQRREIHVSQGRHCELFFWFLGLYNYFTGLLLYLPRVQLKIIEPVWALIRLTPSFAHVEVKVLQPMLDVTSI